MAESNVDNNDSTDDLFESSDTPELGPEPQRDTKPFDVEEFMKEKLPPYVVRCFLAAGFDSVEVIASMDVSESPNNSISVIESFIEKYYSGNKDYCCGPVHPFVFPPGHKLRICNFVSEVKMKSKFLKSRGSSSKVKRKLSKTPGRPNSDAEESRKKRCMSSSDTDSESHSPTVTANQIRTSVAKWIKKQSCSTLCNLKENKDFSIVVSILRKSNIFSVSIKCLACSSCVQLGRKNESFLISNWTRHVYHCKRLHDRSETPKARQQTLSKFLSPVSGSSETSSISVSPPSDSSSIGSHFSESPLLDHSAHDGNPSQSTDSSITDWSRKGREQKKLVEAGFHEDQSHVTDYFDILNEVERLAAENQKLSELLQPSVKDSFSVSVTPVLRHLISNAQKNAECLSKGRRHSVIIKKFSTSLLIYAGPLAYDFMHQNLPNALPSLRTVQRVLSSEYKAIKEGEFRFKELANHLTQHKAPRAISLGEDATRIVARVEWDSETNRCCGFVLPVNSDGLPKVDSFLAVSFEGLEKMFAENAISKYAYCYMAQPLQDTCPSFCLMIMGTDNKFTAESISLRWKYLVDGCQQEGIKVVSIGGDGDSRVLKGMKLATQLFVDAQSNLLFSRLAIPPVWKSWFLVTPTIAFVQDIVHVAVKLKSRILKPSGMLPMGAYTASIQHLRALQVSFGKDEHGLREKDLNHKDKQNYTAVLNIIRASHLLQNIPDAKGTKQFVFIIQCVVDSYLDNDPVKRIESIWYATFFLRYWRQWIILHPQYSLKNFISYNAYICIELNAHALIIFLLTVIEHFNAEASMFVPWQLGSQSCEKVFRSARSMSNVFCTVINFSLLGLLHRLHRLQIQSNLQAQSEVTGISYPQVHRHKPKDGTNAFLGYPLNEISHETIIEAVFQAHSDAKASIESLGMDELLRKHNKFDDLPSATAEVSSDFELDADSDSDSEDDSIKDSLVNSSVLESSLETASDLEQDIGALSEVIDSGIKRKLETLKKSFPTLHRSSKSTIPIYNSLQEVEPGELQNSPFLKVNLGDKVVYIRKTTALWLLQEGERVSSDRLFRVRAKQPFSTLSSGSSRANGKGDICPEVRSEVKLNELCVFLVKGSWKVGKILQFSKYKCKTLKSQEFRESSATICTDIGALCSWFELLPGSGNVFKLCHKGQQSTLHSYVPLSDYVCTITDKCVDTDQDVKSNSILPITRNHFVTTNSIEMKDSCLSFISQLTSKKSSGSAIWTVVNKTHLYQSDKLILERAEYLSDNHILCAQLLLKQAFSELGGLESPLRQQKGLPPLPSKPSLQILHVNGNHWVAASTVNGPYAKLKCSN